MPSNLMRKALRLVGKQTCLRDRDMRAHAQVAWHALLCLRVFFDLFYDWYQSRLAVYKSTIPSNQYIPVRKSCSFRAMREISLDFLTPVVVNIRLHGCKP